MSNKLFVGFSVKFIISWNKYLMINTMKIFLIKKNTTTVSNLNFKIYMNRKHIYLIVKMLNLCRENLL